MFIPKKNVRLFKPSFGSEEIIAIKKILKKSWIGYGPEVKKFEDSWSKYIGTKYSIGVTSCSAALYQCHMHQKCWLCKQSTFWFCLTKILF